MCAGGDGAVGVKGDANGVAPQFKLKQSAGQIGVTRKSWGLTALFRPRAAAKHACDGPVDRIFLFL